MVIDLESVARFAVKATKDLGLPRLAGSKWSYDLCVVKREGVGHVMGFTVVLRSEGQKREVCYGKAIQWEN